MNGKSAAKAADFSFFKNGMKVCFQFPFLKKKNTKLQVW